MLGPEIVVRSAEIVGPEFDARHSATWRAYRYTDRQPPGARSVPRPLPRGGCPSRSTGRACASAPTRSSASTTSRRSAARVPRASTTIRRVLESSWVDLGDGVLRYDIRAQAFCWQMVRSIVGTLVDVGRGRRRPGDILTILRSRDRGAAGPVAPPHGLCLWEVGYERLNAPPTHRSVARVELLVVSVVELSCVVDGDDETVRVACRSCRRRRPRSRPSRCPWPGTPSDRRRRRG